MSIADLIVLGGLPVTVNYFVNRAEPDVGIFSPYVDDWYITEVCGKKKHPSFLSAIQARILATEEESFLDKLMEHYHG